MQWCNTFNIKQSTFYHRIHIQKLSIEDALKNKPRTPSIKAKDFPRKKLNWDIVSEIRKLHKKGLSNIKIGIKYKVDASTISTIVNNKSWVQ